MRYLTLGCATIAIFSTTMSVILWRDLHAERTASAGLREQLDQARLRPATTTTPVVTQAAPAAPSAPRAEPAPAASPAKAPAVSSVANLIIDQRELLKDPEYRKARLAQLRLTLPQNYPGMVELLGLSRDEADKLFDLLAENQLESMNYSLIVGSDGQIDQAQAQERMRAQQQLQARLQESLGAMLGPSRYAQYQDYQLNERQPRMQVAQYTRTFESAGMPLSSAQTTAFIEAMKVEQTRQREETQTMIRSLGPDPNTQSPDTMLRLQEESLRRQTESNRRLLDAAASFLNPGQLEALRADYEQRMAMTRASTRVQREAAARAKDK